MYKAPREKASCKNCPKKRCVLLSSTFNPIFVIQGLLTGGEDGMICSWFSIPDNEQTTPVQITPVQVCFAVLLQGYVHFSEKYLIQNKLEITLISAP